MTTYHGAAVTPGANQTITLGRACLELSKILQPTEEGTASGGSTTTLVDATLLTEPDDHWNQGTIWFLSGTLSGGSAVVTDFANSTNTATFATQAASASGARYAIAGKDYPRWLLRQAVNRAARDMMQVAHEYTNTTTFITVANQETYTIPAGCVNIKRLEIAINTTAPYYYVPHNGWYEDRENGVIRFLPGREPAEDGYYIRIWYQPLDYTELTADTDYIENPYAQMESLIWQAAVYAIRERMQRFKGEETWLTPVLNEAISKADQMKRLYPAPTMVRDVILAGY